MMEEMVFIGKGVRPMFILECTFIKESSTQGMYECV